MSDLDMWLDEFDDVPNSVIDRVLEIKAPAYKRHAYRFAFIDGYGGTYITEDNQDDAKKAVIQHFVNRELTTFVKIN